jgi:sporulation protein YlmC with PRC-barrel domain
MEEYMSDMDKMTSGSLINAEKVRGADVYNVAGEKLGTIEDLVLDKIEGRVQYAVLSFGGFLGLGDKHYPLPWSALKYDTRREGYVVNLSKEQLENAPAHEADEEIDWTPDYGRRIDAFYKTPRMAVTAGRRRPFGA